MPEPFDALAEKWTAGLDTPRRRSRRPFSALAPWDEMAYFDAPKTSLVSIGAGSTGVLLCPTNPMRVGLIISLATGSPVNISTTQETVVNRGIQLVSSYPQMVILQSTHGNICQLAWFGGSTAVVTLYVMEILLRIWRE